MPITHNAALISFLDIEGMLGVLDAGVIVSILEHQKNSGVKGKLAEFGTYKGRSAALLANYVGDDEELHLVDVAEYLELDKLRKISTNFEFHKMDSKFFVEQKLGVKSRDFRFVHSDGSHTFDNVYFDVQNADNIMSDKGVLVIDDYYNPHYPQVAAAVFTYMAREKTDLTMALVGSNKCYICRRGYQKTLIEFLKDGFQEMMEQFGTPVQISKTDRHDMMDCISFKGVPADFPDKVYGPKLYGHYFGVKA